MKHLLFILACVAALCTACSDNDGDDDTIKIAKDQKNQTAYADETERTINFTAAEAWRTEVAYTTTRAENAENWVTLDPPSGDAGEVTINVTLDKNFTGKNRRAEITIICGNTRITVIIEQKGETEEGEIPDEEDEPNLPNIPDPTARRITQIIDYRDETKYRMLFLYDDAGRILTYKSAGWDGNSFSIKDIDASYSYYDDRVVCTATSWDEAYRFSHTTNTALLQNGHIVESEEITEEENTESGKKEVSYLKRSYEYNAEGGLTKLTLTSDYETIVSTCVWDNGVIVSHTFQDKDYPPMQYTYEYYDSEIVSPKPLAYDFICMLIEIGEYGDLLTGYVNLFSNRYLKTIVSTGDEWNKENGTEFFRYETDAEGYVTKVYRTWTPQGGPAGEEALMWEIEYGQ